MALRPADPPPVIAIFALVALLAGGPRAVEIQTRRIITTSDTFRARVRITPVEDQRGFTLTVENEWFYSSTWQALRGADGPMTTWVNWNLRLPIEGEYSVVVDVEGPSGLSVARGSTRVTVF